MLESRGLTLEEIASLDEHGTEPSRGGQELAHRRRMENWFREQAGGLAEILGERARQGELRGIVLVAPAEFFPQLDRPLSDEVRQLVVAAVAEDAVAWPTDQLLTQLERAAAREDEARDDKLVGLLEQGEGQAGSSARGDDAVQAIAGHRVSSLVLARGRQPSGWVYPSCGWMATDGGRLPRPRHAAWPENDLTKRMAGKHCARTPRSACCGRMGRASPARRPSSAGGIGARAGLRT